MTTEHDVTNFAVAGHFSQVDGLSVQLRVEQGEDQAHTFYLPTEDAHNLARWLSYWAGQNDAIEAKRKNAPGTELVDAVADYLEHDLPEG
jgi:hypothetical protein